MLPLDFTPAVALPCPPVAKGLYRGRSVTEEVTLPNREKKDPESVRSPGNELETRMIKPFLSPFNLLASGERNHRR
jgi:hypothetical protein